MDTLLHKCILLEANSRKKKELEKYRNENETLADENGILFIEQQLKKNDSLKNLLYIRQAKYLI
ncbi:hypothetical protein [Chryseobacterium cucumeris]|uniref:hypothetical protein n=1 Tax=Chryseobacterium cucumeris TaxID=1813611 RepID=UPI0023EF7112|nr:hypothetical protein [Chryseobacterium cucumeris]